MKAGKTKRLCKSGKTNGGTRHEIRTCPDCGAKFSATRDDDFCAVCLLRIALTDGGQSTEGQDLGPEPEENVSVGKFLSRKFENYEVITRADGQAIELGRGAMGVTYKAIDTNLKRVAALKAISPQWIRNEWIRERFVREARAAASLRHQHIASVYHLGFTGSTCFYAMEYVEGQTLKQVLDLQGALPEKLALEIASQVAEALGAAHQRHLVHRDIKPANLIVAFDQRNNPMVKVIDFGLVKMTEGDFGDSSASTSGMFLGTPQYASPEQLSGAEVDARSDIYSLGVTLWHMLTNTLPFRGAPACIAGQHLQAPLPVDQLGHLSFPVVSLVTHLLEKDQNKRPQTAEELLTLLQSTMRAICDPKITSHQQAPQKSQLRPVKVSSSTNHLAVGSSLTRLLEPWDFTPFLTEKFKGFTGREWLFREISEWCSNDSPATLLIVGEPGIGKSAIISALIHRHLKGQVLAYHCCRTDTPATLEPASFVLNLAGMLASRLEEYSTMIEGGSTIADSLRRSDTDPVSAFEAAILAPLHRIRQPEKTRYYLLIDGLDEALTRAPPPTILDVLSTRIDRLPPWLRMIATTRNDPGVLRQLRSLRAHILSAQDPRNRTDVRLFIRSRLRQPVFRNMVKENQMILAKLEEGLLRASAGNFLFVKTALDAIEIGQLSFEHLENLPPGLSSLYNVFFRRLFPDPGKDFFWSRKVLETVAAAREPLTREQIAAATQLDAEEKLPPILSRLASFVPPSEGRYALFHKSLFDWLTGWDVQEDQPFAAEYHVSLQNGHARLADLCWAEYQRGYSKLSSFSIRHLPAHLHQLSRDRNLATVLKDFLFLHSKLQHTGPSALIADYELLPANADLRLVQLAIQLSAHVLARDYRQLPGQLTGRLLGSSAPDIQAVIQGAAGYRAWPWLKPLTPSLATPGGPLIRTLEGHTSWVHTVALTPDGRYAISGSGDATLQMWDLESNQPSRRFTGHKGPIKSLAITPDGRCAVSASSDQTLRVWELSSGRCLRILKGHCDPVSLVVIIRDGSRAVSVSSDGTLRVWNLESGRSLHVLTGHTSLVNVLALLPDDQHAISASFNHALQVWNLESGRLVHTLAGHADAVNAVAVTFDGCRAISASSDHMLRLWDLEGGYSIRTFEGHSGGVTAVAITPDGRRAISGSTDQTLRMWDLNTGLSTQTLEGHTHSVTTVVLLSGGSRALSGSPDHTLRLWDLRTGKSVQTLIGHTDWVTTAAVTPDGRRAISGSADHTLRLWDLEKDQSAHTLAGQTDSIIRVLLRPDGHRAVVTSEFHLLSVWDLETGQLVYTLTGHTDWVTAAAVTPDGHHLISASADCSLRLWNLESGQLVQSLPGHARIITTVAITPDCRYAVSASGDHTLRLWDLRIGQTLYTLAGGNTTITAVALTPDGKRVVWGSNAGAVSTWNSEKNETVCIFSGNRRWMTSVAVTPDGQYAVSASASGILQVWDLKTRQLIRELEGHTDLVNVVVTAGAHLAVSASADHSVRVWEIESGRCVAAFCGEGPMLSCAVAPDGRTIITRDKSGRGHLLRLEGLE